MAENDLIQVLLKTNEEDNNEIDPKLLRDIFHLVSKHPLDDERLKCQEKLNMLISQYKGGSKK